MYCVLYCVVLYLLCAVLYVLCAVLCCIVCIVYCIVLYCMYCVLYCVVLHVFCVLLCCKVCILCMYCVSVIDDDNSSVSQANTLEMVNTPPAGMDDYKSYTTFDQHSGDDIDEEKLPLDVGAIIMTMSEFTRSVLVLRLCLNWIVRGVKKLNIF